MDKLYERINWENEPSISTPLNEINLNKMDYSIDAIDDRVIAIDTTKAKQSDLLQSLKTVTYDTSSGVFLFTWNNGTTLTVDLNIEKIPVSFSMSEAGVITMTTADGSTYTADVASLIKTYSFTDSSRIDFTVTTDASGNKTVQADIVDGSITSSKIEASLVANINNANNYAISSKSYAVGGTGTRSGENTDNSKYYYEQARQTDVGQLVPRVTNLETGLSNTMESLNKYEQSGFLSRNLLEASLQTTTKNGITCTNNGDGTYTLNGTSSGQTDFSICDYTDFGKATRLVGCPSSASSSTYSIRAYSESDSGTQNFYNNELGNGLALEYTSSNRKYALLIRILPNVTLSNVVLKPMIVDASLYPSATYADYTPYALGNTDLTNQINDAIDGGYIDGNLNLEWHLGTISGGQPASATNRRYSDFISVEPNQKIRNILPSNVQIAYFTYNVNKTYVGTIGGFDTAEYWTIPSGIYYVRGILKYADDRTMSNESARVYTLPSNADLKESLAQIDSVQNIDSRFSLYGNCSVSDLEVRKSGKMISFYMRVSIQSQLHGAISIGAFQDKPIGKYCFAQINNYTTPFNILDSCSVFIECNSGILYIEDDNSALETNKNYFINGTFMMKE